ncbi:hypothetical protein KIN20_026414 [Parelaphostrongylus tenuis]|uniref:Uncharacterized protein n=1 Tax=Parelaphostrongylus tenuis TaxID=148309 RepID=A0AAD5WCS6_PARTN|nr:hypothetical protein KIN20_026414 [Parelaphostrongylus tenuis]
MKTVLVLATLVAALYGKVYKMEARSAGSLIARLIKNIERRRVLPTDESVGTNHVYRAVQEPQSLPDHMTRIISITTILEERNSRRAQIKKDSEPIMDYYDDFYTGNITVGTPGEYYQYSGFEDVAINHLMTEMNESHT